MSQDLQDLLRRHRASIADAVTDRLRASSAPHYRDADPALLRERSVGLVDAFVASSAGDPTPFVDYMQRVTEDRISEGYYLDEVQLALGILEEKAWHLVTTEIALQRQVALLAIATSTIGAAKDLLARVYLARQQSCEARARALEARVADLFKGTDSVD